MTDRERTMAALCAWAEPGLRARLLKEAWDAGNQNVNELAEAARVDRKTVYADLAAEGIDAKTDRTQGGPKLATPITVSGMYGDDRDNDKLNMMAVAKLRERQDLTLEQAKWVFDERLDAHEAAAWHNKTAPVAQAHDDAVRDAERAVRRWDAAYDALGKTTTAEWAAAHHRFHVAWAGADRSLEKLVACRAELREHTAKLSTSARKVYEEAVTPDRRHPLLTEDNDVEQLAEARAEQAQRAEIAAQTLRASGIGGGQ
ncbi:hypothetical protein ACIP93_33265 [Streptomyces sp. NPDC088745]|uniref:hypothetical protein n=1 Tax=Streptomyces sp. NPDC088745 TaxID=3365884 RepID=UPI00381D9D51